MLNWINVKMTNSHGLFLNNTLGLSMIKTAIKAIAHVGTESAG